MKDTFWIGIKSMVNFCSEIMQNNNYSTIIWQVKLGSIIFKYHETYLRRIAYRNQNAYYQRNSSKYQLTNQCHDHADCRIISRNFNPNGRYIHRFVVAKRNFTLPIKRVYSPPTKQWTFKCCVNFCSKQVPQLVDILVLFNSIHSPMRKYIFPMNSFTQRIKHIKLTKWELQTQI